MPAHVFLAAPTALVVPVLMVMVARAILVSGVLMLLVLMALPAGGRVRPDISGHGRAVRIGDSGGPASSGGLNGPGIPGGRVWPAGRESPNGFGRSLGVLVVMVVLLAQVAVEALVIPVDTLVLPALMARLVLTVLIVMMALPDLLAQVGDGDSAGRGVPVAMVPQVVVVSQIVVAA